MDQGLLTFLSIEENLTEVLLDILKILCKVQVQPSYEYKV